MYKENKSLAEMIREVRGPTDRAAHRLADRVGARMAQRTIENTPVDTGDLRRDIRQKLVVIYVDELGRKVYESGSETGLYYGPYVEEGTGLWGPRHMKYEIKPRDPNGWLVFEPRAPMGPFGEIEGAGHKVYVKKVMHPGSPGNHMFAIGAAMAEHEVEIIAADVMSTWRAEILASV